MANNAPVKSLSFDSRILDENRNKNDIDISKGKSFSFASRTHSDFNHETFVPESIDESNEVDRDESNKAVPDQQISLAQLSEEIHLFVDSLTTKGDDDSPQPFEIPNSVIHFLKKLESLIHQYESTSEETSLVFGRNADDDSTFITAITRLSSLIEALDRFKSNYTMPLINQASSALHHAMVLFEEELRYLLEEEPSPQISNGESNSKHRDSSKNPKGNQDQETEGDFCQLPDQDAETGEEKKTAITFPSLSPETITTIRLISNAMIVSGYEVECCNVFIITRRHIFEEELKKQGFDKISVDDVQKMNWESLEGMIATWVRCFKYCSTHLFPGEHKMYESVFEGHSSTLSRLFADLSSAVFTLMVSFAEAVSMTKRSTEKLFKFLDMYEILRDMSVSMENKAHSIYPNDERSEDLKTEFSMGESRLGESAVSIFCQLENSIKNDNAKTAVPNGAVHPLTRYTMNYLKYACEYRDTLEHVFQHHLRSEESEMYLIVEPEHRSSDEGKKGNKEEKQSPFATQLMTIMELLDANLDAKSKLYKDQSLRYVFLMNNGRYMLQKVKGSPEIHQVVGDNWCRKRSSDVRHYHKSYQRETWSKVLQCLNQEGLQVNGKVYKPVLKERFKNFNQLFDEIHKTQSAWVVSDEQLQSELRVSISAVMIPAYRSFLARFGQTFTPGRQVEKYIKYQPEDIETVIEELFDGNQQNLSMARRRT